jgi:hypothetical protein
VEQLASWSDDSQSGLEAHEPEATAVVITLELSTDSEAGRCFLPIVDGLRRTLYQQRDTILAVDKLRDKARESISERALGARATLGLPFAFATL